MKFSTRALIAQCALLALFVIAPATASAMPPANDDFGDPAALSMLAPYFGSNVDSTVQGDPDNDATRLQALTGWAIHNTVWHTFEAAAAGDVTFTVCSAFQANDITVTGDTVPALVSATSAGGYASRQALTAAGQGDPSGCAVGQYAAVLGPLPMQAGDVLRPVVSSAFGGQTGSYSISTSFTQAPQNDAIASATTLFSRHAESGTNMAASTEPGETNYPYSNYRTVWYQYTAPATDTVDITLCSAMPANLVAYTGASLPLTLVSNAQGNTPGGCGSGMYLTTLAAVPVTGGQTLWIQVGGFSSVTDQGSFVIELGYNGAPGNDNWADAINLGSAETVSTLGDTTNATLEADEPAIAGNGPNANTVWYRWTAPRSGSVEIGSCHVATNYDGAIGVFTGSPLDSLTRVADADSGCDNDAYLMGKVTLTVTQGTIYWIAVGSWSTPGGSDFGLEISSPPVNTIVPSVSGNALVGDELTVDHGTWSGTAPIVYGYAWQRCDVNGNNCVAIAGADAANYTLADADGMHRLKVLVTATNGVGSAQRVSDLTTLVDGDFDLDGVLDSVDNCNFAQSGTIKVNGCAEEGIDVTDASTIAGERALTSTSGLTATTGTASNSPGEDDSVAAPTPTTTDWFRCSDPTLTDPIYCEIRTANAPGNGYIVQEDDLGGYIRARVTWSNDDGDRYEWTDAIPVYKISIGPRPSLSGTPQVGQTMTGDVGSAENQPATESGDDEPSVISSSWEVCSSATDEDTCVAGPAGSSLTVPADAVGKYLRFTVTWSNGLTTRTEDSDASGQVTAAPTPPAGPPANPATPKPFDLASLVFPKNLKLKKLVKTKGKYTIKSVQIACPAGGPACVLSLSMSAVVKVKGKKKTLKLGNSKQTIPAGSTAPIKGQLSKKGLAAVRKAKSLKSTLTITGSGGVQGKKTYVGHVTLLK